MQCEHSGRSPLHLVLRARQGSHACRTRCFSVRSRDVEPALEGASGSGTNRGMATLPGRTGPVAVGVALVDALVDALALADVGQVEAVEEPRRWASGVSGGGAGRCCCCCDGGGGGGGGGHRCSSWACCGCCGCRSSSSSYDSSIMADLARAVDSAAADDDGPATTELDESDADSAGLLRPGPDDRPRGPWRGRRSAIVVSVSDALRARTQHAPPASLVWGEEGPSLDLPTREEFFRSTRSRPITVERGWESEMTFSGFGRISVPDGEGGGGPKSPMGGFSRWGPRCSDDGLSN